MVGTCLGRRNRPHLLEAWGSRFNLQIDPFSPHYLYKNTGFYFQDDWKLTPTLTANIGLRWEYFGRPIERYDHIATFDLAAGKQHLAAPPDEPEQRAKRGRLARAVPA